MLTPFERYRPSVTELDRDLETLQDRIQDFLDEIYAQPGSNTIQYDNVYLTSGAQNLFEHGLGRAYRGWRIVDTDNSAIVYRDTSATDDVTKFLVLGCTANCTVSIEVF